MHLLPRNHDEDEACFVLADELGDTEASKRHTALLRPSQAMQRGGHVDLAESFMTAASRESSLQNSEHRPCYHEDQSLLSW